MPTDDSDAGIAFALVLGAGAATGVGAGVVFFPSLVRFASRRTLAAALGLSAGVMTYVSFVEIFQKSVDSFTDGGQNEDKASIYATLCFFGGSVLMLLLNYVVTSLLGGHHHHHDPPVDHSKAQKGPPSSTKAESEVTRTETQNQADASEPEPVVSSEKTSQGEAKSQDKEIVFAPNCCVDNPSEQLEDYKNMAATIEEYENREDQQWGGVNREKTPSGGIGSDTDQDAEAEHEKAQKLMRMSVNTALAIALHNFPEGLATFVATMNDPTVGAVLAVAIAIHNIPEGLCVAMPIYYATGERWKAFMWGVLSGIAEPIAALLGWAILYKSFSDTLYAILFGLVSGMMVIISVRELLPTAHRYDPEDTVVTYSFLTGMGIMALSLVLFVI